MKCWIKVFRAYLSAFIKRNFVFLKLCITFTILNSCYSEFSACVLMNHMHHSKFCVRKIQFQWNNVNRLIKLHNLIVVFDSIWSFIDYSHSVHNHSVFLSKTAFHVFQTAASQTQCTCSLHLPWKKAKLILYHFKEIYQWSILLYATLCKKLLGVSW